MPSIRYRGEGKDQVDLTLPLRLSGYTWNYLNSIGLKPRRCLKCFKFMIVEDSKLWHDDCYFAINYFAKIAEKKRIQNDL